MNIKQIVKLNNQFYQLISKDFSRTRQKPWEGWGRVVENIKKYFGEKDTLLEKNKIEANSSKDKLNETEIRVLDIGCGNGRFCDYLHKYLGKFSYTGVDINNDFLSEGQKKCSKLTKVESKFIKKDVILGIKNIKSTYNVICSFGVTHHLPNNDFREKWFLSLLDLVKKDLKNSMVILSFWDFTKMPGDYLVSWGDGVEKPRYCHKYSGEEIAKIIKIYKHKGFKLIDKYNSDNKNLYLIFGKI